MELGRTDCPRGRDLRPSPHMTTRRRPLFTLFNSSLLAVISATVTQAASEEGTPTNAPTVITAGPEWIPLRPEMEIEPGSALDFSDLAGSGSPAGKNRRVIARPAGQVAFTDSPG